MKNILLIGNGINIHYGGFSTEKLLKKIGSKHYCGKKTDCPFYLKSVLVTKNNVNDKINEIEQQHNSKDKNAFLSELLNINFDCFFTTNYTYEIEEFLLNKHASYKDIKKYLVNNIKRRDKRNIYTHVKIDDKDIWHIHGIKEKNGSTIFDLNSYVRLVKDIVCDNDNNYASSRKKSESWIDLFINNNVYMLGLGMDYSEIDLWWLLGRKHYRNSKKIRNKAKTVYFEPYTGKIDKDKIDLLKLYDVNIKNFNISILPNDKNKKKKYATFYLKTLNSLRKIIK